MRKIGLGSVFLAGVLVALWSWDSAAHGEVPEEWQEIVAEYTGSHPFALWPATFVEEYNAYLEEIGETRFSRFQSLGQEIESTLQRQGWREANLEKERGEVMTRWFSRDRLMEARGFRDRVFALDTYPLGYSFIQEGETFTELSEGVPHTRFPELRNIARYFVEATRVEAARGNPQEAFRFIEAGLFLGEELYLPMNQIEGLTALAIINMSLDSLWEMGWSLWPNEEPEVWEQVLRKLHDREVIFGRVVPLEASNMLNELKTTYVGQSYDEFSESRKQLGWLGFAEDIGDEKAFYQAYFTEGGWKKDMAQLMRLFSVQFEVAELPPHERLEAYEKWFEEAATPDDSLYLFSSMNEEVMGSLLKREILYLAEFRLAYLSLALRRYGVAHRALPESLTELPEIQEDDRWQQNPFTGEPIDFSPDSDGFTLSAVYPGMRDGWREKLYRRVDFF
ncbi:MAG: hypothetical protein LAT58_12660 [Opitutales bacterium]|nr:hypothetical protein [Opitutales bacterium]